MRTLAGRVMRLSNRCHQIQTAGADATVDNIGLGHFPAQLLAAAADPLAVDVAVDEELGQDVVQLLARWRPRRCAAWAGRTRA